MQSTSCMAYADTCFGAPGATNIIEVGNHWVSPCSGTAQRNAPPYHQKVGWISKGFNLFISVPQLPQVIPAVTQPGSIYKAKRYAKTYRRELAATACGQKMRKTNASWFPKPMLIQPSSFVGWICQTTWISKLNLEFQKLIKFDQAPTRPASLFQSFPIIWNPANLKIPISQKLPKSETQSPPLSQCSQYRMSRPPLWESGFARNNDALKKGWELCFIPLPPGIQKVKS